MFIPKEIIINAKVAEDPVAERIVDQCRGVPVKYVENGRNDNIVRSSKILNSCGTGMREKILAGKQVLYVAPAGNNTVDQFEMPDSRLLCPHFDRLKLASNGCPYACDWCYLKGTYRGAFPFMTVYAEHDKIKAKISKRLSATDENVIFNSGELADSLALDHLTGSVAEFIPFFAASDNGYLFTLTKSDNVNGILDLEHNGHTIPAWSLNDDKVSRTYEIGAPTFERRLMAAQKVQNAGYPLRIRLDPIVPFNGWKESYADTIKTIFESISPERITLGTLRFEKAFFNMRNSIFAAGSALPEIVGQMEPMFEPQVFAGSSQPKVGKYSYSKDQRIGIFNFAIQEIQKYSDCKIALCKESATVWAKTGLDISKCSCVCQLDYADMSGAV